MGPEQNQQPQPSIAERDSGRLSMPPAFGVVKHRLMTAPAALLAVAVSTPLRLLACIFTAGVLRGGLSSPLSSAVSICTQASACAAKAASAPVRTLHS